MFSISFPSVDSLSIEMLKLILYSTGDLPVGGFPLYRTAFLFLVFSVTGWIIETVYRSCYARKLTNPGFLLGPMVPLYGAGGLILLYTGFLAEDFSLPVRFIFYFTSLTLLEYITGEFLLLVFKRRYWDYRQNRFNIRGIICLKFSVYWAIMGLVFEYTIAPFAMILVNFLPAEGTGLVNVAIFSLMCVDFMYSSGIIKKAMQLNGTNLKKILYSRHGGDEETARINRPSITDSLKAQLRNIASSVTKPVAGKLIYSGAGFSLTGEALQRILAGRKKIKRLTISMKPLSAIHRLRNKNRKAK